ncbi:MAG: ABC transporter permease [Euryarchaeota archaeon]|nr:ABC transporter permease [Euryarchaeota archaeon]
MTEGRPLPLVPMPRRREARGSRFLWYRVKSSPLTLFGFGLILAYMIVAVAAPVIAPTPSEWKNPYEPQPAFGDDLLPPGSPDCERACPLGTTEFGADIFYGIVWGTRISMAMGLAVTLAGVAIGLVLGLFAGWYGGWVDDVLMRATDVFLSLPLLVLALAVVVAFGRGLENVALALVAVWWPPYTRLVRGQVLLLRESHFVEAARASALPDLQILARHVVPNALNPVIVQATLDIGTVVLVAAALSFIGFSSSTTLLPEWGRLVALGQDYMATGQWWTVFFPGLAIFGFVLGFNLLGDGLRDILDPRGRR